MTLTLIFLIMTVKLGPGYQKYKYRRETLHYPVLWFCNFGVTIVGTMRPGTMLHHLIVSDLDLPAVAWLTLQRRPRQRPWHNQSQSQRPDKRLRWWHRIPGPPWSCQTATSVPAPTLASGARMSNCPTCLRTSGGTSEACMSWPGPWQ